MMYLGQVIVSYDVPRLSGAADVDKLILSLQLPVPLEEVHRDLIHAALGVNPRRVKRFMNVLALHFGLARAAADRGSYVPEALRGEKSEQLARLLKLLLISYRYSGVFSVAQADWALIARLQEASNRFVHESSTSPASA